MHYNKNTELPEEIQRELPPKAQKLYRDVFNKNYPDSRESIQPNSEEIAHKAAWHAVRNAFKEIDGRWESQS